MDPWTKAPLESEARIRLRAKKQRFQTKSGRIKTNCSYGDE